MLPMYAEEIANVAAEYYENYRLNKCKKTDFSDSKHFITSCIEKAFSIKHNKDCYGFICYDNIGKNEEDGYTIGTPWDQHKKQPVVGAIAEYKNSQDEDCFGVIISTANIVHPSLLPSLVLNIITVEDGHIIYKQVQTIICNIVHIKQNHEVIDTKQRVFFKESDNFKYEIPFSDNQDSLLLLNKTNHISTILTKNNDLEISSE
jgi:hypothetical protein